MDPSFVDIIKDFELPWTCGRDFVWPEIAFKNPFYITMNWKDIMWILFQVATQVIKELLIAIVAKIFIKLCELLGTAICQTLELVGDVTAALATGNRTGLASVIKESICGPDVDDDTVDQGGMKRVKKTNKIFKPMESKSTYKRMMSEMYGVVNEISYRDYKKDPTSTPQQKVNRGIVEVNKMLSEMEKIVNNNLRLKTEMGVQSSHFWKSTGRRFSKINERIIRIANRLKELSQ